jgi:cell division inhibitor SulA/protein ImuA
MAEAPAAPVTGDREERLRTLLRRRGPEHGDLWRGRRSHDELPVLPTGHARLDAFLPGGGWPLGALTELLAERPGLGEFHLLLPLLSSITPVPDRRRAPLRGAGWAILVDPPWMPYPHALHGHGVDLRRLLLVRTPDAKQSLWACEQALRGVRGGTVLIWLQRQRQQAAFSHLRRLQLAARAGRKSAFVFRAASAAGQSSPASLRLHLARERGGLRITMLKGRGAEPHRSLLLPRLEHPLPERHAPGVAAATVVPLAGGPVRSGRMESGEGEACRS